MTVIKDRKYYKWGSTPNVKVVGSPTISNGIASSFSRTNHLRLPFPFRPGDKTWEIVFKITTASTAPSANVMQSIFGNFNKTYQNAPEISIKDTSVFYIGVPRDGQTSFIIKNEDTSAQAQTNTTYWLKLEFTGTAYIFSYSTNGTNYTQGYIKESSEIMYQAIEGFTIGNNIYDDSHDQSFLGSIDLNECYIKVDSKYIWIGMVDECTEQEAIYSEDKNTSYLLMIPSENNNNKWNASVRVGQLDWLWVTYGNGKFVAVGYASRSGRDTGYFGISEDGETWTGGPIDSVGSPNGSTIWEGVTYGNGKFVAVGGYGYIATSTDGETWTSSRKIISNFICYGVAYGNGKFIVVANNGQIATSTNGETWTTPIQVGTSDWYNITYTDNKFVIVAKDGSIATSTDGITWTTPIQVGSNIWYSVTYGNGKFVAVGENGYTSISEDGLTWTTPISLGSSNKRSVTYGNGKFVAVGENGYTATLPDYLSIQFALAYGKDTTYAKNTGIPTVPTIYAKNDESKTVLVPNIRRVGDLQAASLYKPEIIKGFNDATYATIPTPTFPAATASTWEWNFRFKHKDTGVIQRIYSQGKKYPSGIEIGADNKLCLTMSTSTSSYNIVNAIKGTSVLQDGEWYDVKVKFDGSAYTVQSPQVGNLAYWSTPKVVGSYYWYGVTYDNNKFVAVGTSGYTSTSTDGITWTPVKVGSNTWRGITYANSKFVAVGGSGYTTTSTDGLTWTTPIQVGSNNWYGVTYGNGKFVAVGNNGYTSTSTDGLTWTTPVQVGSNAWNGVTYGNGKFIAVGNNGYTSTSIDGITWTTPVQVGSNYWQAVTYGNGKFVAVGYTGSTITSTNGITWTTPVSVSTHNWYGIAYSDAGIFVACGINLDGTKGYVTSSNDGITWTTPAQLGTTGWSSITVGDYGFIVVGNSYTAQSFEIYKENTTKITSTSNWEIGYELNRNDGKTEFAGELDLAHCNIFVDGETWWEGTNGSVTVNKNNYDSKTDKIRRYI